MVLQLYLPLHWNMLYILDVGKRLLTGGTLYHNAFDPNPPLIFYVSALTNKLAQLFSTSSVAVFRAVHYISIVYALWASYVLMPAKHRHWLMLTFAFCLLILPGPAFAEREHWMIALTMPYFLLLYQRSQNVDWNIFSKIGISAIAAFGFCLKPYFLFSVVCAELLVLYWKRDWRWLFRVEIAVCVLINIVYLVFIACAIPEYYQHMLPKVMRWYAFYHNPIAVLQHEAILNFVVLCGFLIISYRRVSHFETFLCVIALGFAGSFIWQGKGWFYHALPLITVTIMLAMFFICERRRGWWIILYLQCLLVLLPMAMTYYPLIKCYRHKDCRYQALVDVVKTYGAQNKPIFFFTTSMADSIPVMYYAPAKMSSRFPYFWMINGILNSKEGSEYVRGAIMTDLEDYQPKLVFVDVRSDKPYIDRPFDYLTFMKKYRTFNALWRHYDFIKTIDYYAVYARRS